MPNEDALNLTPAPRVLRMLGRIEFTPWQCLAELIDNAVDAFLEEREALRDGPADGPLFPQVDIELSAGQEIRAGAGTLRVSDNGPGMSVDFLRDAVRAGFSSNSSTDKLGLFGMGFNVATARLGGRTEVWTTRRQDEAWYGARIDFDEIERSGSFVVPPLRRPKTSAEEGAHGSQIVISKLDRERALYLRSGGGLRSTREKLSRVYNKIMRDVGLQIVVVGTPLVSREFCVWSDKRQVTTPGEFGDVPAILPIDADLGTRLYCEDCWVWLDGPDENKCPSCSQTDRLRPRGRRVTGWLGIQRFFDQSDYGVDLIRNGRVIEERSKVFFSWLNPETDDAALEYPLEQTHWGGRIVGELSLDFVPLASHQKDAFDKTTREWRLAEEVVRGKGPIVQKSRLLAGFLDKNVSPLARLHAGYRRGQPAGLRWLVPGESTKGRGFNRPAQQWAAEFWAGNPDYQSDELWYQAVLVAEGASQKKGADIPPDLRGGDEFSAEAEDAAQEDREKGEGPDSAAVPARVDAVREDDATLSGLFELPDLPGAPHLEVTAQRLTTGTLPSRRPVQFAAVASRIEFTYDPSHQLFAQSLIEPVDCLVEELGYQFLARSSTTQAEYPLSVIIRWLREKYFSWSVQSFQSTREDAGALLAELVEFYTEALGPLKGQLADFVTKEERRAIAQAVVRKDHMGEDRVNEVIDNGEYPRYLGPASLPRLVEQWPEFILDNVFFSLAYSDVDPSDQAHIVWEVVTLLRDVMWAANPDVPNRGDTEWRVRLARAVNSLRLLEAWRVTT